ncbi:STAS domain-containing protein [Spirochaeta isovalerica]|uniref:Anti-sigma factor antagonist n=1 Tax=Spirochaeta isovalerica TaxID=150 RepID=A0A841R856_9SPIO|nr:STAS domain-containing protein [Spirochaeta isovalerica]MBB6481464.1 anti-sigma B factor antagonist [Spirochaeta isovalerica]
MKVAEKNGIRIITLETDHLDALNSDEIKKNMISNSEGAEKVILNLGKITFVDSSGLGAILTVFRHIGSLKGSMVIAEPRESVKVLFKLVRLSHMIKVFDTESEALAHFQ